MGLFRKMFGLETAEEHRADAAAHYEQGDYGGAKLRYERALDKTPREDAAGRRELQERVDDCRNQLAEQRIAEGDRQREAGHGDLASLEYRGAADVAADPQIVARAELRIEQLERSDAVAQAAPPEELSDEERLAVLAGTWEGDQADEYERLGEPLDEALLALLDDEPERARELLEALLEQTDEPRYLWLEVARARMRSEDEAGGEQALRRFLEALDADEGGEARLVAHVELARLADDRGEFDAAVEEYQAAMEALEGDPRPYFLLGRFLRDKGHPAEAVDVVESALDVMDTAHPDWQVLQELGLAQAEAGKDDEAVQTLEQVLRMLASRRHLDFPPQATLALARLHEKQGRPERAADLYRSLTQGSDRENHALYYREGARVLEELGLDDEARRFTQRAEALEAGAGAETEAETEVGLADEAADESTGESADDEEARRAAAGGGQD